MRPVLIYMIKNDQVITAPVGDAVIDEWKRFKSVDFVDGGGARIVVPFTNIDKIIRPS